MTSAFLRLTTLMGAVLSMGMVTGTGWPIWQRRAANSRSFDERSGSVDLRSAFSHS